MIKKKISPKWSPDIYVLSNINVDQSLQQRINNGELQNLEKNKESKGDHIQSIILDLKTLLGEQVMITKIWTYKTPLSQLQLTSLLFYHEYVIIEIKCTNSREQYKIHCSLQKNGQRIWLFLDQSFQGVRDYGPQIKDQQSMKGTCEKRFKNPYWKPIQLRKHDVKCDFYVLIEWLYQKEINYKKYHLLSSNCQRFAQKVVNYVIKNG